MNDEIYHEIVVNLDDYCSWKTFSKYVILIKIDKELNHECEVENFNRNIKTNLIDEWFKI